MKAVILAAGQGQRLAPLTENCPKGMVEVAGESIISRQLTRFRGAGVDPVVIVKGYKEESVPDYGAKHYTNTEYDSTNMVYSLFCAAPELDSDFLVSYGDILYSAEVLEKVLASPADVGVSYDVDWKNFFGERFEDPFEDAESFVMGENHAIERIGEKNPKPEDVQGQYVGLIKFSATGASWIREIQADCAPEDKEIGWGRPFRNSYMTDLLQELVRRGKPVTGVPIHGGWVEVDNPRDHEIATEQVTKGLV